MTVIDETAAATSRRRMAPAERRAALLAAAADVLRHHPLAELTYERMAEYADVSKTLPYRYFDSIDEVAIELLDATVGAIDRATPAAIADAGSFSGKVAAALSLWCDAIEADGALIGSLLDGRPFPALRARIDERDEAAVALWSETIADEFDVDRADAQLLATQMVAGATAVLMRWVVERLDRDVVIDRFARSVEGAASALADG